MNRVEIILLEKKQSGVYKVTVNGKQIFICNDDENKAKAEAFDAYLIAKTDKNNDVYMAYHSI